MGFEARQWRAEHGLAGPRHPDPPAVFGVHFPRLSGTFTVTVASLAFPASSTASIVSV